MNDWGRDWTPKAVVKAILAISVTSAWLVGFLWILKESLTNTSFREDVEGVLAVLAVAGIIVQQIIDRLFHRGD